MSELAKVHEISLDRTLIFEHFIILKHKNGTLAAKIPVSPDKSWEAFKKFTKRWEIAKRESQDEQT